MESPLLFLASAVTDASSDVRVPPLMVNVGTRSDPSGCHWYIGTGASTTGSGGQIMAKKEADSAALRRLARIGNKDTSTS
jgi:hypothetical protein